MIQEPTRLFDDAAAGRISGFDGGWNNYLKLGLSYDTRDLERDPSDGVLAQIAGELGTRVLGSDFDYQLVTTQVAGFWSPFGTEPRLVLAGRVGYSMQFGDVPFFSKQTIATTSYDVEGLGGYHTLRAYKRRRFVGDSAVFASAEARWSFVETYLGSQHLRFMLVGFGDGGRVHDGVRLDFDEWRGAYGVGFRLIWNLSTAVSFDLAKGDESEVFYLELGHPF